MAFSVPSQMSYDMSSSFGKELHGFKVEATANQRKPNDSLLGKEEGTVSTVKSRAFFETVLLGIFTIMMAAVPLALTSVPSPELVLQLREIIEEWCTPSTCFVVLIVGVLLATSGALGGSGSSASPEQNVKFTESYLIQQPVSGTQMDPSRMPEVYFSSDISRQAHALAHTSAFPVQAAQPASVMMPVSYGDSVPPHSSLPSPRQSPKRAEAEHFTMRRDTMYESNLDERFVGTVENLLNSRVDSQFSPRVVEEKHRQSVDEGFMPRATDDRFLVNMKDTFPSRDDERQSSSAEVSLEPQQEDNLNLCTENTHAYDELVDKSEESDREEEEHAGSEADDEGEAEGEVKYDSDDDSVQHSLEDNHPESDKVSEVSQNCKRTVGSSTYSPNVPGAGDVSSFPPPMSPSQRLTHGGNNFLFRTAESPPSLSSRRRPLTLPTSPILSRTSQAQPIPTLAGNSQAQELHRKISSHVERERSESESDHPSGLSPPTPREHARRPVSSLPSRRCADFSKRTPKFSPKMPQEPPRPPFVSTNPAAKAHSSSKIARPDILSQIGTFPKGVPSLKGEKLETVLVKLSGRSNLSPSSSLRASFPSLIKQQSMPARRPREVRVVDDDSIDTDPEKQDDDDVDQRTEDFLKKFRQEMRLQRQESLQRNRRGESP